MSKLLYIAFLGGLLWSSQSKAQVVLEALDAPDTFFLPTGWTISMQPVRYLASVYDNNYYPIDVNNLSTQPTTAELGALAPDATNDPLLNYQGVIGKYPLVSTGIEHPQVDKAFEYRVYHAGKIVFNAPSISSSINLPPVLSKAMIPAKYIKNSTQDEAVYLNAYFSDNDPQNHMQISGNSEVSVFISADKQLELVQLDMNKGIGKNGKGLLLTTFEIGNAKMELRLLPGIPDKYAGRRTKEYNNSPFVKNEYQHDLFYMPITASGDGNTWLNNNLGANYANLKKHNFYPLQQAMYIVDKDAVGYGYIYGRDSDGHELTIDRIDPTPITKNRTQIPKIQGDPCPIGFKTPTIGRMMKVHGVSSWNSNVNYFIFRQYPNSQNNKPFGEELRLSIYDDVGLSQSILPNNTSYNGLAYFYMTTSMNSRYHAISPYFFIRLSNPQANPQTGFESPNFDNSHQLNNIIWRRSPKTFGGHSWNASDGLGVPAGLRCIKE